MLDEGDRRDHGCGDEEDSHRVRRQVMIANRDQLLEHLRSLAESPRGAQWPPPMRDANTVVGPERGKKRPRDDTGCRPEEDEGPRDKILYAGGGGSRGQAQAPRGLKDYGAAPTSRAQLVRQLGMSTGSSSAVGTYGDGGNCNAKATHLGEEVSYRARGKPLEDARERDFQEPHGDHGLVSVVTHHHHHDPPEYPVLDNQRHHYARHQTSSHQLRPSHHVAELPAVGAHHIGRCYYGGRGSFPAIPRTPNPAAHGLEGSR